MNDKSIPQELINYRRYVLKTMWGGAMHWFAASRGDIEIDSHIPPRELQDARKMGEMYFDRFEKEAEKLLADLQSNGDIQISGPEESILKTRRKSARHAIAINLAASPSIQPFGPRSHAGIHRTISDRLSRSDQSQHPTSFWL